MSAIGKAPKPRRPFSAMCKVAKIAPVNEHSAVYVACDLPSTRFKAGDQVRVTIEPLDRSQIRYRGKVK